MSILLYMIDFFQICKQIQMMFNYLIKILYNIFESKFKNLFRDEDLNSNVFIRNAADTV